MAHDFLLTFEQAVEIDAYVSGYQVVEEARARYKQKYALQYIPKVIVLPVESYLNFVQRNGMYGLADELIHTVSPQQASKIIEIRFSRARYNASEMHLLRTQYQKMNKPLLMGACVINKATGAPIVVDLCKEREDIDSFDLFSDGIVQLWQSAWCETTLSQIYTNPQSKEVLRQRDYSVMVWCIETPKPIEEEALDWFDQLPLLSPMKPKGHHNDVNAPRDPIKWTSAFSRMLPKRTE